MVEFKGYFADMEADIWARHASDSYPIVAGDFNAKSPSWGSRTLDVRGSVLESFAAALDLWLEKIRSVPTFGRHYCAVTEGFIRRWMAGQERSL